MSTFTKIENIDSVHCDVFNGLNLPISINLFQFISINIYTFLRDKVAALRRGSDFFCIFKFSHQILQKYSMEVRFKLEVVYYYNSD